MGAFGASGFVVAEQTLERSLGARLRFGVAQQAVAVVIGHHDTEHLEGELLGVEVTP
jgi:hypothetical protein